MTSMTQVVGLGWTILPVRVILTTGCRSKDRRDELILAMEPRMHAVQDGQLPVPFEEALSANRVLVLGEEHYVQEHQEFLASMLPALHKQGYRLLLIEQSHSVSWIADDYVLGVLDEIPWRLRAFEGFTLDSTQHTA